MSNRTIQITLNDMKIQSLFSVIMVEEKIKNQDT